MKPGWVGSVDGSGEFETLRFARRAPGGAGEAVVYWVVPDLAKKVMTNSPETRFAWGKAHLAAGDGLAKIMQPSLGPAISVVLAVPQFDLVVASNATNIGEQIDRIEGR